MTEEDKLGFWVSGFADGESCFGIHSGKHKRGDSVNRTINFIIKLRDDDTEILYQIQKALDCGTVRGYKNPYRGENRACAFTVSKVSDLFEKVIPFFEKYPLRAKKRLDFAIWKKAVTLMYLVSKQPNSSLGRKPHGVSKWTLEQQKEFELLAIELKDNRKYKGPR